jgi:hypothetical protein
MYHKALAVLLTTYNYQLLIELSFVNHLDWLSLYISETQHLVRAFKYPCETYFQ